MALLSERLEAASIQEAFNRQVPPESRASVALIATVPQSLSGEVRPLADEIGDPMIREALRKAFSLLDRLADSLRRLSAVLRYA
jgi:hypothetical protein